MYKPFIPLTLLLLLGAYPSVAQSWRSELYPAKGISPATANFYTDKLIQDFSFAGYHLGTKEVPILPTQVLDVTSPPYGADATGSEDATALIQKALDDAGQRGGGVVYLPKGTYKVTPVANKNYCLLIRYSGVVLRGDGPGQTFLYNASTTMRSKAIVRVEAGTSWAAPGENRRLITRDLMQPTRTIPVESTAGYKVGDLVIVRNYIDNDWIEKHRMLEYWRDQGTALGGLLYCRQVVTIDPARQELTLDIPIRYALERAHGAAVYKAPPMLTEVGIEQLSIGNRQSHVEGDWSEESYRTPANGSYQCHDSWAISMAQVYNGWISHVASYAPTGNTSGAHLLSNGIRLWQTKNVSVLNCDFKRPQFGGGGGNGYMYRIMGNETLLRDCVAEFNRHGFVMSNMSSSGNVFLRCLDKDTGSQTGLSGYQKTSGSGSDHHMHFSHSNLFDQCTVENSFFAAGWRPWGGKAIHGLTAAHSVYWNLTSNGTQTHAVQTQQGRYGYVIGTSGTKPDVRTSEWKAGTAAITAPLDHVEGIGTGTGLIPQSLYLDQKRVRGADAGESRKPQPRGSR